MEHYSDLYSRENVMSPTALDAVECLPVMKELDAEPTVGELSKAIDSLASGKAPGSDGILPALIKHCKTTLLQALHELLCQCWKEGAVPQGTRDDKIVTLYKTKGERSDCNNYRGISFHNIISKTFAWVLLIYLQKLAERIYPESHMQWRQTRLHPCPNISSGYSSLFSSDMHLALQQRVSTCEPDQMADYSTSPTSKMKFRQALIRDMLFANDMEVATHTQQELHSLMSCFSQACKDFGLARTSG